jgi:hypothetical protein
MTFFVYITLKHYYFNSVAMATTVCLSREGIIRINICGTIFECPSKTLKTFKESRLANLHLQTKNYDSARNEYFFDRNPLMFNSILDGCRKGTIHLPKDICGASFSEELDYWGVSPSHVAPCCWEALYRNENDVAKIRKVTKYLRCEAGLVEEERDISPWRKNIWLFLDEPSSSVNAMVRNYLNVLFLYLTLIKHSLFNQ